jgi:alpha-glucosidase (family GH31 glycosyl hydrolase)
MPIYVLAGAILPFDPVRQYTSEQVDGPTTLKIYPGADGEFTFYADDGTSLDYLIGKASWTRLKWNDADRTLTIEPAPPAGATNEPVDRKFRVEIVGGDASKDVHYRGERVSVDFGN